ncbi:phosphatidylinositol-specific phospholipase C domain-containing protein [bacterium]|nr:phosphatidylinositol-specific phospholipase C domain-containing protein [Actinomycetota bacterium]NDG29243.1 phosphatidylinositol-specific phospholipase C domain-containing protein [bacterium]
MDTRTLITLTFIGGILLGGIALAIYASLKLFNVPPSDSQLTKNLNVYSDLIKPAPIGCPNEFTLCDYYMAASGSSILPKNTVYTYVTTESLSKVVRGGARLVELFVYSVNKIPVVGLANKKTGKMTTYNTVKLEDCCVMLANTIFSADATIGYKNPFVLSLVFQTNDNAFLNQCAEVLKTTLRKFMLDSSYSYQRKNLALEPICDLMGKLIIVSGENIKGNGMDELVNMSWSSSNMRRLTYSQASQTYDIDELIEYNKRNITLVVPDLDTTTFENKNPEICYSYGCQWVAMAYGSLDNAMEVYTGKFLESSFAVKPEILRYKPLTYEKPKPQDPALSFQPKRMTSPMFDYTIAGVK